MAKIVVVAVFVMPRVFFPFLHLIRISIYIFRWFLFCLVHVVVRLGFASTFIAVKEQFYNIEGIHPFRPVRPPVRTFVGRFIPPPLDRPFIRPFIILVH